MACLPELNICCMCGVRLAPDDFDGICWECDRKCHLCFCDLEDDNSDTICPNCAEKEYRIELHENIEGN